MLILIIIMKHNVNWLLIHALINLSSIIHSNASIFYEPFDSHYNPTINSVYGTGNQLKDISYRGYCAIICNDDSTQNRREYSDDHCCEGNSVNDIICLSRSQCESLKSKFQMYVFKITLLSYSIIAIVSSCCSFGFVYCGTANKSFKLNNAICVSALILCGAFIIPIMIVFMISTIKGMTMTELFGANLDSLSSFEFIEGVEIKENNKRVINRNVLTSNRNEMNNHNDSNNSKTINYNEKVEIELKTN